MHILRSTPIAALLLAAACAPHARTPAPAPEGRIVPLEQEAAAPAPDKTEKEKGAKPPLAGLALAPESVQRDPQDPMPVHVPRVVPFMPVAPGDTAGWRMPVTPNLRARRVVTYGSRRLPPDPARPGVEMWSYPADLSGSPAKP
jgi:hypothetical protein